MEVARLVLQNALLHDPRSGWRRPGSVVVEGGRILSLLPPGVPLPPTPCRVDCRGGLLMPGFYDAHVHLVFGGWTLQRLRASDFPTRQDLLQEIARRAREAEADPARLSGWVLGQDLHPGEAMPTLEELDEATGSVPLCLDTHDLHSCLCNSAALMLADAFAREDPLGGEVVRDAGGRPTGFLRENAALWMRPVIPAASPQDRRAWLLKAQAHAHTFGITGVGENLRREDLDLYRDLEAEDLLRLRVQGWRNDGNLDEGVLELAPYFSPRLRVDTLKLFADGALGSQSAAMSQAYVDGSRGGLVADAGTLGEWMRRGLERGWRLAVHAIGDAAVGTMLDLFAQLKAEGLPVGGFRHRIEHAQFIRPEDHGRFAELEILPSVQPLHCATDQDGFATRLSRGQAAIAFPWRSLLRHGLPLPIGTDWPVEPLDPRLNLVHGQTRQSTGGLHLIGQDEALDLGQLLRGMTWEAAHAAGWGEELGCLGLGAHADLVLWEQDPTAVPIGELSKLGPRRVYSGGHAVVEEA
jgi:predicted amidohydrolase YtcJ